MRINVWLAAIVALVGTGASAAGLNTLGDLKVEPTASGARVVISGDQAPTFTVFRLSAPDRLVVDLSGADASGIKGHHAGAGPVRGVVASQFSDDRASVGRVTLSLDGVQTYDVKADGKRVVIAVDGKGGQAAPAAAASAEPAAKPEPAAAQAAASP
ncbi:MAG: AMIN domain-containing protein, partial [Myxococcaceae bacterium]